MQADDVMLMKLCHVTLQAQPLWQAACLVRLQMPICLACKSLALWQDLLTPPLICLQGLHSILVVTRRGCLSSKLLHL